MRAAERAIRELGQDPVTLADNGGCDANWTNARGLPTVHLGTGQHGAHTTGEWIPVDEFLPACRLVEKIVVA